jgi:hypothetical protein
VSIKVGTIAAHVEGRVQLAGVQPFTDL